MALVGPSERLRVLHVTSGLAPSLGGPSKAAIDMCRALAEKGIEVALFSPNVADIGGWLPFRRGSLLHTETSQTTVIDGVEVTSFRAQWPTRFKFSPMLGRELHRRIQQFDVVHIHSLYLFPTAVAAHYARRYRVPYVLRPHGSLDPYHRRHHRVGKAAYTLLVEQRNLDGAAAIHYTSEDELEKAKTVRIRAPGVVIPLAISPGEFDATSSRGAFRQRHPEIANKRLVVFLGRLTPKKGIDLLMRAFSDVVKSYPDSHLVVAGPDEGRYGEKLKLAARHNGIDRLTTFTGMLTGKDKLALLADANVWVLPSHSENFALAAVEAMACGLPVIITNEVGIQREVAEHGAGLVIAPTVDEIAGSICRILGDRPLADRLGRAARQLVEQRFTWDVVSGRLVELYSAVRPPERTFHKTAVVAR